MSRVRGARQPVQANLIEFRNSKHIRRPFVGDVSLAWQIQDVRRPGMAVFRRLLVWDPGIQSLGRQPVVQDRRFQERLSWRVKSFLQKAP